MLNPRNKILIPENWIKKPVVSTLSQLKLNRKAEIIGEIQEITKKSSHFLNEIAKYKQDMRTRQGLSEAPTDFPKKKVDYTYKEHPFALPTSQKDQQPASFRLASQEPIKNDPKSPPGNANTSLVIFPKIQKIQHPGTPINFSLKSQSPSIKNSSFYRDFQITPKPNQVIPRDSPTTFIFSKSKPIFTKKTNFLDIYEARNLSDFQEDQQNKKNKKDSSFNITKRLKSKYKILSNKMLTSGFSHYL